MSAPESPYAPFLRRLFLPLAAYALVLKKSRLAPVFEREGLWPLLDGWRSEPFLYLALFLAFGAALAAAPGRRSRLALAIAAALTAALTATVETAGYYLHSVTGSSVDWVLFHMFLVRMRELCNVAASESNVQLAALVAYPLLIAALALRLRPWNRAPAPASPRRRWLWPVGAAASAALAAAPSLTLADRDLDRDALLQVAASAGGSLLEPISEARFDPARARAARLVAKGPRRYRNLVVVMLESTRASATSPYRTDLATTPFLAELAARSLLMERAYAVLPHTSKATIATLCGIEPHLRTPVTENDPGGMPARCLAELLREQGFRTLYMTSHIGDFEDWDDLVANLGFEDFVPLEAMGDTSGFERAHYFGKEDDVMLAPSRRWLEAHRDAPFFVNYLTSTPHHDYLAPKRYGRHAFAPDDTLNRYLNAVHYQDHFLRNLFELYRELGLYENTVFVLIGDHGQGFKEHGRAGHSNVPYEEGIHVPFLIHAPGSFEGGQRVSEVVNQLDVLPTAVELLGFDLEGGQYGGRAVWRSDPARRSPFTCWHERECVGSVGARFKYLHFFGDRPDELYDLAADPEERRNLAARQPAQVAELREAAVTWRRDVNAGYEAHQGRSGLARFLEVGAGAAR